MIGEAARATGDSHDKADSHIKEAQVSLDAATKITNASGIHTSCTSSTTRTPRISRCDCLSLKNADELSGTPEEKYIRKTTLWTTSVTVRKSSNDAIAKSATLVYSRDRGREFNRGRSLAISTGASMVRADTFPDRRRLSLEDPEDPVEFPDQQARRSKTLYSNPSGECATLDDDILEPLPADHINVKVSEIIFQSEPGLHQAIEDSCSSIIDSVVVAVHDLQDLDLLSSTDSPRSTGSSLGSSEIDQPRVLRTMPTLSEAMIQQMMPNITPDEYAELKPSSPLWQKGNLPEQTSRYPPLHHLPQEIMHQIYTHLCPADFNHARHSCRAWYLSSLDYSLLEIMLLRGGWSNCIRPMLLDSEIDGNAEWLMGRSLARECSLGPNWKGNGLAESRSIEHEPAHVPKTSFASISTIDIGDLETSLSGAGTTSNGIMTMSECTRFLMLAHGCQVFIYEVNRNHRYNPEDENDIAAGDLKPVTSIICPRKVIATSMDTSCDRYVIAILMEDRMGLVSSIDEKSISCKNEKKTPIFSSSSRSGSSPIASHFIPMPVEKSTPTIYHPICSADDPPRSVAICPQRRCVAFGCSTGIELHWMDALSGQELQRWFPLVAPSDHLYFLPPRFGIDSVKKLRLISSCGKPWQKKYTALPKKEEKQKYSPFWAAIAGTHSANWIGLGATTGNNPSSNIDHYRGVPLSDGTHILFTDPASRDLCLGSDAPIGGTTALLRKIRFKGPPNATLVTYAVGRDLSAGVRIVAAYKYDDFQEKIVLLFSVPNDIFAKCVAEQGHHYPHHVAHLRSKANSMDWMNWLDNPTSGLDLSSGRQSWSSSTSSGSASPWPIYLSGQQIGKCHGITELTIDSGPQMIVWAFGREGIAKTWRIDNGHLQSHIRRSVLRGGNIRDDHESLDDTMPNSTCSLIPLVSSRRSSFALTAHGQHGSESFDGSASGFLPQRPANNQQEIRSEYDGDVPAMTLFDGDIDFLLWQQRQEAGIDDADVGDDGLEAVALSNYLSGESWSHILSVGQTTAGGPDGLVGFWKVDVEIL